MKYRCISLTTIELGACVGGVAIPHWFIIRHICFEQIKIPKGGEGDKTHWQRFRKIYQELAAIVIFGLMFLGASLSGGSKAMVLSSILCGLIANGFWTLVLRGGPGRLVAF